MKFKDVFSKTAVLGMASAIMFTGGCAKQANNYKNEINNDIVQEEVEDLPYKVYDVSYYTDTNNELHKVSKVPQIRTVQEKIMYHIPKGYTYDEKEQKLYKEEKVIKVVDGKQVIETITKLDDFVDCNHNIIENDITYSCPIDEYDYVTKEVYDKISHACRIHVILTQFSLPENAYIIDNTDLELHTCYIDEIVEQEKTLGLK